MNAFRHQNTMSPDKDIFLVFDGDRLDLQSPVGETELSDLDNIEVHIK